MSDVTEKQIEHEFRRQVYLCGGLGKDAMLTIVKESFTNGFRDVCRKCGKQFRFHDGHVCIVKMKTLIQALKGGDDE